jgi:hypothetical protein
MSSSKVSDKTNFNIVGMAEIEEAQKILENKDTKKRMTHLLQLLYQFRNRRAPSLQMRTKEKKLSMMRNLKNKRTQL